MACVCFVVGQTALAQNAMHLESDACSEEFSNVITARAEMEAMREIEIAQTYILKPDSVLEYSCFFQRYEEAGIGANTFSDNVSDPPLYQDPPLEFSPSGPYPDFLPTITPDTVDTPRMSPAQDQLQPGAQPPDGISDHHTNNAIGALVADSEFRHIFSSFGHVYAGGTFTNVTGANGCNPMQLVWNFAKCWDFPKQDFRTFRELTLIDPRIVPSYMIMTCSDAQRYQRWADNYAQVNVMGPGTEGGPDPVVMHLEKMDPAQCSSFAPVETGVSVYRGAPPTLQSFNDAVCVAPGCYYDGTACVQ